MIIWECVKLVIGWNWVNDLPICEHGERVLKRLKEKCMCLKDEKKKITSCSYKEHNESCSMSNAVGGWKSKVPLDGETISNCFRFFFVNSIICY